MPARAHTEPANGLLGELERELAAGDGSTYNRRVREEAIVVVPNRVLDKAAAIAAIDEAGGWDGFGFEDEHEERLGPDAAIISYRFSGHRGAFEYIAQLSSVYTREADGEWRLLLHQQTPLG